MSAETVEQILDPRMAFAWGVAGSAAVETLRVVIAHERGYMPVRYKRFSFWFVRAMLAAFGGALAVAYDVNSPILAMHIGACTPAIIENFATKPPAASTPRLQPPAPSSESEAGT